MVFSEVYGVYFSVLAELITQAQTGALTRDQLERIVREKGFGESILTIPDKLRDESWPLLTRDLHTPLRHAPTRPLTTLEKRWMKTLLSDPRVRLFDPPTEGLEFLSPFRIRAPALEMRRNRREFFPDHAGKGSLLSS